MTKPVSESRRIDIIRGAMAALRKQGLAYPSYDAIADEANMSRQLIRHYFPDAEALMEMTGQALAMAYKEIFAQAILDTDETERLPMFLDFYFDFLSEKGLPKPADDAVYDALFALAARSEKVRAELKGQYSLLRMILAHEIQISTRLPQRACEDLAFLVVSLMYGHWKMVATLGFDRGLNRVSRDAVDRLIASYRDRYEDPDEEPDGLPPEDGA
ncbi:MAG: TetR/AcrR family transcriptional regulator [Qingshengfaniella sp.]